MRLIGHFFASGDLRRDLMERVSSIMQEGEAFNRGLVVKGAPPPPALPAALAGPRTGVNIYFLFYP